MEAELAGGAATSYPGPLRSITVTVPGSVG